MPSCVIWASERRKGCAPEEDVALYRSAAFVLHTYKLGETDQIVVLFTQEFGKLRAVARRSHSPRRHAASYYQPLMLLNAIVYGRPGQSLYRMHSVDILQALRPLHEDFGLLRCGLYMTELIDVATHEREPAQNFLSVPPDPGTARPDVRPYAAAPSLRTASVDGDWLYAAAPVLCAVYPRPRSPGAHVQSASWRPPVHDLRRTVRQTLTVSPETLTYLRRALAGDSTVDPSDATGGHRCSRSLNNSYMPT